MTLYTSALGVYINPVESRDLHAPRDITDLYHGPYTLYIVLINYGTIHLLIEAGILHTANCMVF